MVRASAGSRLAWLSVTMRLIVRSQFSGVARRNEMRDIRILSSVLWHEPHLPRTTWLATGIPSSAAGGACACAGNASAAQARHENTPAVPILRTRSTSVMKDPFGDEQRQAADHARQRHGRAALTIGVEQIRHVPVLA